MLVLICSAVAVFALAGCGSGSGDGLATAPSIESEVEVSPPETLGRSDDAAPAAATERVFTHKMTRRTGENPFASVGYECNICTFEQWLAIDPPDGWSKGPAQVLLADEGEMRSTPSFDGVPDSVDFIPAVPGNEYKLIVKNLDATILERGPAGFVVQATVERDTLLRFSAGRRVHELTDTSGNTFVLFAYGVDPRDVVIPDFDDPDALGDFVAPTGWTYTSRVIDEDLSLDARGTTTVLAIRNELTSTWELRSDAGSYGPTPTTGP